MNTYLSSLFLLFPLELNANADAEAAAMRSHILIKAWQ
jgi:hypothetical protein